MVGLSKTGFVEGEPERIVPFPKSQLKYDAFVKFWMVNEEIRGTQPSCSTALKLMLWEYKAFEKMKATMSV